MIEFAPAILPDAQLLGQLRQRCWAATYRGIYPDEMIDRFDYPWHEAQDARRIASSGYDVRVIRLDSAPIGYLTWQDGTPPRLLSLYLLPEYQRQGVGRLAFDLMSGWCHEQSKPYFLCECHPENAPARAFYRKMGGVLVGREQGDAPWQNSVTFRFGVNIVHRCRWCTASPTYRAYHDTEWGVPCHDDRVLFELLILEGFQAGLSWLCIPNKRDAFREDFDGFDWEKVAAYDEDKVAALLADPRIVRNRRKVSAAIRNAQVFREIRDEFGSFDAYLTTFTGGRTFIEYGPVTSSLSDALSLDLYRRGMRFVGSTILYSFLQAIGVVNGHEPGCDLYVGHKQQGGGMGGTASL